MTTQIIPGVETIRPGRMQPGDIVADLDNTVKIEVESVTLTKIRCRGENVPLWEIKGWSYGMLNTRSPITFMTVPGRKWYLLRRTP
jgi:hypothetical protein